MAAKLQYILYIVFAIFAVCMVVLYKYLNEKEKMRCNERLQIAEFESSIKYTGAQRRNIEEEILLRMTPSSTPETPHRKFGVVVMV